MKRKVDKKAKSSLLRGFLKMLCILSIILVAVVMMVSLIFAIYIEKNINKSVDDELFEGLSNGSSSKLYYYEFSDRENRVGEVVQIDDELYGGYRCEYVSIDKVPKNLIDAFVSIEDKRFYEHSGVDWRRSISAGANYFLKFNKSYGGSTITQQLIKNVTQKDEYSFQRKIQEIFWALDLESKMEKDEILQMYLNIINLSQGCYGVQAASKYYYSKDVSELTLSECACIAAITNSPTYYDPLRNPENNQKRRDVILNQMYEQGYITEEELAAALSDPIALNVYNGGETNSVTSWYIDMVIEDVISDLMSERDCSRQAATLMIYTGGLNIYTAMDIEVQRELEEYYTNEKNFYSTSDAEQPQSSAIVIDPATGDILGVVGSIGEKRGNRVQNFATQTLRPAGSVIKPLSVYAPALESGIINWGSVYDDVPVRFENISTSGEAEYKAWPKNSKGEYRGLTNINYALANSVNTVSVRVLDDLGLDASFSFLRDKLHMNALIEKKELPGGEIITDMDYAALALGQFNYGVTVREITAAYSIFANNGIYNYSRSYLKVTDINDKTILSNDYKGEVVLSETTATLMTMMLQNVISEGTGISIRLDDIVECAGKTGTTQSNYDRWFIGYSPYYICGVWYGYEYPKSLSGTASNTAIKYWDEVMINLHENIEDASKKEFYMSGDIVEAEYCRDSGLLMTDACRNDPRGSRSEHGFFAKGDEPKILCDCHVNVSYDTVNGGIACEDCLPQNVKTVGLINVTRVFPMQIYVTDAEYTWRYIGENTLPCTVSSLPFYANLLKEGEYSGISKKDLQYNRFCRVDFNYYHWKKKYE